MCLRKLAIVNDTLEALGALKEYQKLRNWIIRIIIGLIIRVFYNSAYVFMFFNYLNVIIFCRWTLIIFLLNYPIYVIILSSLISTAIFGLVLYMCTHLFL